MSIGARLPADRAQDPVRAVGPLTPGTEPCPRLVPAPGRGRDRSGFRLLWVPNRRSGTASCAMAVTVPVRVRQERESAWSTGSSEAFMPTRPLGHLEFAICSHFSRVRSQQWRSGAAMTVLSGRRLSLVHSARTGPGPGSCALTPLALAATPDAQHPLVVCVKA